MFLGALALVDAQSTAVEFVAVERAQRGVRTSSVGEFAKAVAFWTTGFSIANQSKTHNLAGLREQLRQVVFARFVGDVANENGSFGTIAAIGSTATSAAESTATTVFAASVRTTSAATATVATATTASSVSTAAAAAAAISTITATAAKTAAVSAAHDDGIY